MRSPIADLGDEILGEARVRVLCGVEVCRAVSVGAGHDFSARTRVRSDLSRRYKEGE